MFQAQVIINSIFMLERVITTLIFIRIIMSWISMGRSNSFIDYINSITEPILQPMRHLVYEVFGYSGMIDFSPILTILGLRILSNFLARLVWVIF